MALPLGAHLTWVWFLSDSQPTSTLALVWDEKQVVSHLISRRLLFLLPPTHTSDTLQAEPAGPPVPTF